MAMQVAGFSDGGFVAHRVFLDGMTSKFSVWVDRFGRLQDAERFDSRGVAYAVRRGSAVWVRLAERVRVLAPAVAYNGPAPVARSSAVADCGSPWVACHNPEA